MKLLLANPNMTEAVTEAVVREARRVAAPGTEIVGATADFGVAIVSTEADNAVAGHAALDLVARHQAGCDAVILAISFDTALAAVRGIASVPVLGMTEAALLAACLVGRRFGLVTFGGMSRPLYLDLVERAGLMGRLAGCETLEIASAEAYLDAAGLDAAVRDAARRLAERDGAAAVVICGAAIAGMAHRLQGSVPVPLLDGVACAVRQAEMLVGLGVKPRPAAAALAKKAAPRGLGPELSRLL